MLDLSDLSSCPLVLLFSCPLVLLSSCLPVLLFSCSLVFLSSCPLVFLSSCSLKNYCGIGVWRQLLLHQRIENEAITKVNAVNKML